jgi:RNA polymerase sigma factor (sigma-70 family)
MTAPTVSGSSTWEATLAEARTDSSAGSFVALATNGLTRAYRLAGLLLGNAPDAEDAVGDALERAWARFGQLRDPDGFEPWFDRIVINGCRDRLRRRRTVRFIPLEPGHDRPATGDPFRDVIERDDVLRSMRVLSDEEREIVVLHFWADLTLTDVARRTGLPVGTVKSRLHRALERMRHQP